MRHTDSNIRFFEARSEEFDRFADVLTLLRKAFAYMDSRIDPPSSLHRLDLDSLINKGRDEQLFVAASNELIVGCVFAAIRSDHIYLGKLAVDARYCGQGIARTLIENVEVLAIAAGKNCVDLETRVELVENQRYFERMGFKKIAENSHEGYDRITSFRYRKQL